ncbi:MAG: radical SAM protein [Dehalococcoidales bacterium]|nr:radical SAM protein [Dehalococcoidales bacterium]
MAKPIDTRPYLSRETGTIFKDWGGRIPIALIYPNSYYLGMSNLGIHAIYSLLNGYADIVCERAFWEPGAGTQPPAVLSLESRRPLTDFAVIAFSVTYELDYFNIPHILKASGIPLYAADRDERHPLVIAGGPCVTANPMPLAPFFDCLGIGEAESILPAMLPVLSAGLQDSRSQLLQELSSLPGLYVPKANDGTSVARQWVKDLDAFPAHSVVLTPDTELGNLYLIEAERGCGWGCRFCLVSTTFRPMRYRSVDNLLAQAEEGLRHRKRLGLVGPAVADHPHLEELLIRLQGMGAELSISSLRIKPLPAIALRELTRSGARTIALAPEAGSQRLRQVLRKGISEDDIFAAMLKVAEQGVKQLKLYFMIGLPTETDDDVLAIADLTLKCKTILDKQQTGCRIILSIAPFIPKAGTPFQWLPMAELPILERRLSLLRNSLLPKGIQLKNESLAWSQVQGVLARGDTSLAEVLAGMEKVSLSGWRRATAAYHLDAEHYAHRRWATTEKLPWAVIDPGTAMTYLERELNRAMG